MTTSNNGSTCRTSDGATLHFRHDNPDDGPAVLFLNALGCNMSMWDHSAQQLEHAHTLRFDSRGHGQSSAARLPLSIDRLIDDALCVLDASGQDRAHVCGCSVGGLVAQLLAARHPDRVDRLVLANTATRIGIHQTWTERIELVTTNGLASLGPSLPDRFFSAHFVETNQSTVEATIDDVVSGDAESYAAWCQVLADTDTSSELGNIVSDTLVIAGEVDVSTTSDMSAHLARRINGARLETLEAAGHLAPLEAPQRFAFLVDQFLTGESIRSNTIGATNG